MSAPTPSAPPPGPNPVLVRFVGAPLLVAAAAGLFTWCYRSGVPYPVNALIGVLLVLGWWEIFTLFEAKGYRPAKNAALVVGLAWIFTILTPMTPMTHRLFSPIVTFMENVSLLPSALLIYLLLRMTFARDRLRVEDAAATMFGFLFVGLLMGAMLVVPEGPMEARRASLVESWIQRLGLILVVAKGGDMAAYVVGKFVGANPLAPSISPKKTWEGFIAAMVVGVGGGLLYVAQTPLYGVNPAEKNVGWMAITLLVIALAVAAQMGDLVESAFKRWAGVKDSGRLLPEFGGALDLIDSLLLTVPVFLFVDLRIFPMILSAATGGGSPPPAP